MAHSEKCPLCYGEGVLPINPTESTTAVPPTKECHGCSGKGWITVQDW